MIICVFCYNIYMNKVYTFVFFGIAGSSKGTQVGLLQKYLEDKNIVSDMVFVSTGNSYRKLIGSDNYTGKLVKDVSRAGILLPDFLTDSLFVETLISKLKEDSSITTDGFPRTIPQSEVFESAMNFYNRDKIDVIYIELSKETAIKRMKLRGRYDDTDEGIKKRLEEYINNVIPSMEYFKDKDKYKMHIINGDQSVKNVHTDIIKSLNL